MSRGGEWKRDRRPWRRGAPAPNTGPERPAQASEESRAPAEEGGKAGDSFSTACGDLAAALQCVYTSEGKRFSAEVSLTIKTGTRNEGRVKRCSNVLDSESAGGRGSA